MCPAIAPGARFHFTNRRDRIRIRKKARPLAADCFGGLSTSGGQGTILLNLRRLTLRRSTYVCVERLEVASKGLQEVDGGGQAAETIFADETP